MAAKKTNKKTKKRRVTIRKVINSIKKKGGYPSSDTSSNRDYMNMSDGDFEQPIDDEDYLIDKFVRLSGKTKGEIIRYSKGVNQRIKEDFKNFLKNGSNSDIQIEIDDLIQKNSVIDFIADVSKLQH